MQSSPSPTPNARRDWLAALLLRQHDRFTSRLAVGLARWRAVSRDHRRRLRRKAALSAAGAALMLAMTAGPLLPTLHAASITVDNGVVALADDGQCSLREALSNAAYDTQAYASLGECAAGSGVDTIHLPVNGDFLIEDYEFTPFGDFGLISVGDEVIIEGNGSTIRRDTADTDEFSILLSYQTDITINDVTISGGSGEFGGGVVVFGGEFAIVESTVSGNSAEVLGGGIFGYLSDILIEGSTISGNTSSSFGGGVAVYGNHLDVVNSTISGNSAAAIGGLSVGYLYDDDVLTTATITNSTITDNSAEQAAGGIGVFETGVLTISRSIVSGNQAGVNMVGQEIYNAGGTVNADDYNVFGHNGFDNPEAFLNFVPGGSDINATSDDMNLPLDQILDTTLADNGGPTATHLLVDGSPALDHAPSADCAAAPVDGVDQRGAARNDDIPGTGSDTTHLCDSGAVEGTVSTAAVADIFVSTAVAGTTGDGLDFGSEDIIWWDGVEWVLFFDGSAAGLEPNNAKHNINAFSIPDPEEGDFIFSFAQNRWRVPDITAPVDGMDLVYWNALTEEFSAYFDGSDVGLTNKTQEKIDGLHVLQGTDAPPELSAAAGGSCEAYLLVSTSGPGKVPNYSGGTLSFGGEDVLGFCATALGSNTAGLWHKVIDGSDQGMPKNATDSISLSEDGNTLYLTTKGTFNVDGAIGGHSMIYEYNMTAETFSGPTFIATDEGLAEKVDGLHVE